MRIGKPSIRQIHKILDIYTVHAAQQGKHIIPMAIPGLPAGACAVWLTIVPALAKGVSLRNLSFGNTFSSFWMIDGNESHLIDEV